MTTNDRDLLEKRVREIEREIDSAHENQPLFQRRSRPLAQWYLLTMHDDYVRLPLLLEPELTDREYSAIVENSKGALQYALKWTDSLPEDTEFEIPVSVDQQIYEEASEFFNLALRYFRVIAPFVMFSRGLATVSTNGSMGLRFKCSPRTISFDVLNVLVRLHFGINSATDYGANQALASELAAIRRTVRPSGPQGISYAVALPRLRGIAGRFSQRMADRGGFGREWSLAGLSAEELRLILSSLFVISQVHIACVAHGARTFRLEGTGAVSSLLVHTVGGWAERLSEVSGVDQSRVESLVSLLSYRRDAAKRDVSLTPFVLLNTGLLAICPMLLISSDHERNFLAHAARVLKTEYDSKSRTFEDRMIERCRSLATAMGCSFSDRVTLTDESGQTDIDGAFYDEESNFLLLSQMKFVIAPSEPGEILERQGREQEALAQTRRVSQMSRRDPTGVWNACFPGIAFPNPTIGHCVLMSGSCGSEASLELSIPVLEMSHFSALVEKGHRLEPVWERIGEFGYVPVQGRDFTIEELEMTFGRFSIVWDGYHITESDFWVNQNAS